ncbi:hypothetical protein FSP39_019579 [Pinctada imbricata]|uniref:Tetratricopeptide repeat protein 7 N-terminal domain-containing protein n=1 Tax=Pinctada imbricata TaxID=66713 RepID=A0AA88XXK5_PINIB|nr:hypothetical protein FSP39_019579 [Pinctada imbricata]
MYLDLYFSDFYVNFITAESKLEDFVEQNMPLDKNILKAKSELDDVETILRNLSQKQSKITVESKLLLAKVLYCKGSHQAVLDIYDKLGLDSLCKDNIPPRLLQLIAEAYAIKGFCLEAIGPSSTSKFKIAEQEEKVTECYERAGDLALLSQQEREKAMLSSSGGVVREEMGGILESAIQQSPLMYIKHGEISKAVGRFRELLRVIESRFTQSLRQGLARQLAEVLIRGMCEKTYSPPDLTRSPGKDSGSMKPRKYSGSRLFIPRDVNEEALLLLLIAEAVATREAVLNRSEEHKEARQHSFGNATAVYDLLAITLVKRAQFLKLSESFEKAMRFSYDEFHIWHQFANALICAGKYSRALLVLKECSSVRPDNTVVLLQAAKLCYEYLHQVDEGIRLVKQALEGSNENSPLEARLHVALGIGYSLKALEVKLQTDRHNLHKQAVQAFSKAHTLDPNDYLALFHLGLQLAIQRQISEAIKYTRLALRYRNDHIHSLHLLVLLFTAQKKYEEAMSLIKAALEEYPDNLSLLLTRCKLEEVLQGPEVALVTCKHMLQLWKDLYENDSDVDEISSERPSRPPTANDRSTFDRRSFAQLQLSECTDRDTGSIRAESVAASRVEQTLSEVASSLGSHLQSKLGSQQTWLLQAQIWLHLAELYLSLNKMSEAEACVQETSSIFPLSHQVAFMKGRVQEHKQHFVDAKASYENAVSINPAHTKSLQHLGMVLHYLENDKRAEKVLREAVNIDPTSHQSWYLLGLVEESLGQDEAASKCHMTALDLESTSPIVPFTIIPRLLI